MRLCKYKQKGAVSGSLDMGQASKLALRASMSLAATGATGSYPARLWRLCVMEVFLFHFMYAQCIALYF